MRMRMGIRRIVALAALLVAAPLATEAAVIYDFTVLGAVDFNGGGQWTGGFVLESPTFITGAQSFEPADLVSCSAILDGSPGQCRNQSFYPAGTYVAGYETVGFGVVSAEYFFYFTAGSFGTVGTYDSQLLDGINDASLTVSLVDDPPPPQVPEPGTLALLGGGLAGLGLARRRRT